jgi:hypothetical protein
MRRFAIGLTDGEDPRTTMPCDALLGREVMGHTACHAMIPFFKQLTTRRNVDIAIAYIVDMCYQALTERETASCRALVSSLLD